jgi:hypothetical protein
MYTQTIIHAPALGKNAELRAALEERNTAANAAGSPHALAASMFALEPVLIHRIRFENLAAIEAYQDKQRTDSAFLAATAKIGQCLARPQSIVLHEELVMTPVTTPPKFLIINRICPAAGKAGEVRALIEDRISTAQPGLLGARLGVQVASLDGLAFRVTLLFASMAAIDDFRAAAITDAGTRQFLEAVASLSRTPVQQRWNRVLAPFPPAS